MGTSTVLPFGPQHPVLPEPMHLDLVVEDEHVVEVVPQIGFIHRGLEKLVENHDIQQFVYVAERICGICSFGHSLGYCETVESLMDLEVPRRAQYLRVILHELSRIHSHMLWLGLAADSFGFESLFMHTWRLRERILDIFEMTTGGRVILSFTNVGGVNHDINDTMLEDISNRLDVFREEYQRIIDAFLKDSSVKSRLVGVGYLSEQQAKDLCMVGPFARASNVHFDVRMVGNGAYGELEHFEPITSTDGDCYARVDVRVHEVLQSIDIIQELIGKIPHDGIGERTKAAPPAGAQAANILEQPRGECYYFAQGNGTRNLDRMRMRTPTTQNLAGMVTALEGCDLADVPMVILTIDPCISCAER
jgi:ech hydrogenase subunit E